MSISLPKHPQIQYLTNFQDLVSLPFQGEVNAMCWTRELIGDFAEIVQQVDSDENIVELSENDLHALHLSEQGKLARELLLNDLQCLKEQGAAPILNVIQHYERDESNPFFPTDVYSFHVDRAPIPSATYLCTYFGASSELVPNADAEQKIHVPEIRAALKKRFPGPEEAFENHLRDHFLDLHYQAKPHAQTIQLGLGHLWKLAIDHPQNPVLPCVHRAPQENPGQKRLLLIC